MDEVDPRTSLVNAIITLAVVAGLAFVGFIIKVTKGDDVRTPELAVMGERSSADGDLTMERAMADIADRGAPKENGPKVINRELIHPVARNEMLRKEITDRFEILVGCELLDGRESSASRLWMAHQGREFVAHLYFATAPELAGRVGSGVSIGDEAWEVVRKLLRTRTARVFTRWEPATDEPGHYWAMIYVDGEGGADRRFLSEILVANGLADFVEVEMMLPDNRTHSSEFLRRLNALEQMARAGGRGAWRLQAAR